MPRVGVAWHPFGQPEFIANYRQSLIARHKELAQVLPQFSDTQGLLAVTSARFKSPQLPCGTRPRSEVTPGGVMSAQQQCNYSHSARAHAFLECLRVALEMPRALRTVG